MFIRQSGLLQQRRPARIGAQVLEKRIDPQLAKTRIAIAVGAIQPLERRISITPESVDLTHLISGGLRGHLDKACERGIGRPGVFRGPAGDCEGRLARPLVFLQPCFPRLPR